MKKQEDCFYYQEERAMEGRIPCCKLHHGLGNCPCENCEKFISEAEARDIVRNHSCDGKQEKSPYKVISDACHDAACLVKNLSESVQISLFDMWVGELQREGHKRISEGKGWLCDFKWIETEDDKR